MIKLRQENDPASFLNNEKIELETPGVKLFKLFKNNVDNYLFNLITVQESVLHC